MINRQLPQIFTVAFFLIVFLLIGLLGFQIERTAQEINNAYNNEVIFNDKGLLSLKRGTLIFTGDIMLDRGVKSAIEDYGQGDSRFPFLKISGELKRADVLFGNLESIISDKGTKKGSIYSFRADPKAINGLLYAGFDIVSVANNHIFDYGRVAMEDSLKRLKSAGIDYVGGGFSYKEAHSPVIKNVRGTEIAYLAYTNKGSRLWSAKGENSGICCLDKEDLGRDIFAAKKKSDILIVSMHFGDEYSGHPNNQQKRFARLAIDSGADLVIGHHPHVVQSIEKYKKGYIAYSLGNFIFDQAFSEETERGLLLEVLIENGKIKKIIPKGIRINDFYQSELAID